MNTHINKITDTKSNVAASNIDIQQDAKYEGSFKVEDNRSETIAQRKKQDAANNSPQVKQLKAIQAMANNSSHVKQLRALQAMVNDHNAYRQNVVQKIAQQIPGNKAVVQAVLKKGGFNIVGETHTDYSHSPNSSEKTLRREEKEAYNDIGVTGGYWTEEEMELGKVARNIPLSEYAPWDDSFKRPKELTRRGDTFELKLLQIMTFLVQKLENSQYSPSRSAQNMVNSGINYISQMLLGKEGGEMQDTGDYKAYYDKLIVFNTLQAAQKLQLTKDLVTYGLARTKIQRPGNDANHAKLIREVSKSRSMVMHVAGVEAQNTGKKGIWKVGSIHAEDIIAKTPDPGYGILDLTEAKKIWPGTELENL